MKKKKATFISVGCEIPLPRLYKSDLHPSQIPIPSKLICPICRNILLIPGRDSCNHIYCSKCFQNHYKKTKSCFITNQRCESTLYEVPQLVEELMNLKVYCIYRKKGCHWEGIYKNLQGHLNNECMKQRIQCPNCNCSMKVYRNELDAHKARCPHRLIMCNCGDFIELCDMEEHKKACLKRLVQCEKCEKMIEYDCLVKHKCVPKINTIITNTEDAKAIQQSEDKPNKIIAISDTEKENVTQKSIELQKNIINKKRNQNNISIDEDDSFLINTLESDTYFDGDEAQLLLQKALLTLPEKQRLVFQMKYFEDMKYDDISEILGTSVGALKASYHHAVKKVEKFLGEPG